MNRSRFRIRALMAVVLVVALALGLVANAWNLLHLQGRGPAQDLARGVLSVVAVVSALAMLWFLVRWGRSQSRLSEIREERERLVRELKAAALPRASNQRERDQDGP